MSVLTKFSPRNRRTASIKVLSDQAIKKAAKKSIEDQKKLSKKAHKLNTQTANR